MAVYCPYPYIHTLPDGPSLVSHLQETGCPWLQGHFSKDTASVFPVAISEWVSGTQGTGNWIQMGKGAFAYTLELICSLVAAYRPMHSQSKNEQGGVFRMEISTLWVSGVSVVHTLLSLLTTWPAHETIPYERSTQHKPRWLCSGLSTICKELLCV